MESGERRTDERNSTEGGKLRLSPIARGYIWASRVLTACIEMVCPGLLGLWLDSRVGTIPLFTLLGFSGGLVLGVWHLLRMLNSKPPNS